MDLDMNLGFSVLCKCIENDTKDKIYKKWLSDEARYSMDFETYYNKHKENKHEKMSEEEQKDIFEEFKDL